MAIIEALSLKKSYGGTKALDGVNLELEAGSVHALLGENGAGKSTLVKILSGAIEPDSGEIRLDGSPLSLSGTQHAKTSGIGWVAQELSLFPELDILANLFPTSGPTKNGFLDKKVRDELARPILDSLGLHYSTKTLVGSLTLAERQLVEISRALIQKPKVLILDEPTSALERGTSDKFLEILKVLRDSGVSVLFVSHILQEVIDLCDKVTILRDGKNVVTNEAISDHSLSSMIDAMVGNKTVHSLSKRNVSQNVASAEHNLIFQNVSTKKSLKNVSLSVSPGEIVGLAGLVGSGHEEILKVIAGQTRVESGSITLPDGERQPRNLIDSVKRGVAFVSGDRKRFGLMLDKSISENIGTVRVCALGKDGFWISPRKMLQDSLGFIEKLRIRTSSPHLLAGSLSGGNQQKVVFAKWLNASPSLLLLDDPTRGVDVGAKGEMHRIIDELSHSMIPTVINSTDLEELTDICDRVYVFKNGEIIREMSKQELSISELLVAMN